MKNQPAISKTAQSAFRLALTVGSRRTQPGWASRLARPTSSSSAAGSRRFEEPDDPAAVHQGEAVAVRERFGPVGRSAAVVSASASLKPILDEVVRRRLGPGQKPPAIGRRSEPVRIRLQHGRRVVFGVDRDADKKSVRRREPLLQAFHHARDPGARQRTARENERGDPDSIVQIGLRDGAARSLLEAGTRPAASRRAQIMGRAHGRRRVLD